MSILRGLEAIINETLFGQLSLKYHQMVALRWLIERGIEPIQATNLVHSLYEHVKGCWQRQNCEFQRSASRENWRFTLNTKISAHNTSVEKQLEKAIARLAQQGRLLPDAWANQVPVASGLLNATADKKACVDLVHGVQPGSFDLIELKMTTRSGHALFGAMEVLLYGVLYMFSVRFGKELYPDTRRSDVLDASRIRLIVLAPAHYYDNLPQLWMQQFSQVLTSALETEWHRAALRVLSIELQFQQFPEAFRWPCTDHDLIAGLQGRHQVSSS